MEYVIGAIWSGMELLCCLFFNRAFLPRKEYNRKYLHKTLLIWIIVCIYTNIPINQFVKLILTAAAYTTLSILWLQGTFIVHICLTVICYIFIASMDMMAINGMCYLLSISYNTLIWRKFSYFLLITSEKLFIVLFSWIWKCSKKTENLGKYHSKWILLSVLFPSVSAVMLAILFYTSPRDGDIPIIIVVFAGILMIANIAMIYVINNIEKATKQEQELRLLRQQISIQTENYGALKKNYSVQRKAMHEFKRHIQVIRDLLAHTQYETALDYVKQLQADRTLNVFSISSNNPVIDVVLNQKYLVAQENNVKMQVKVNNLSSVAIRTNELVVLLSNLLDNAIEACMKLEDSREIVCSILKEDSIYISIRNTSEPVTIVRGEIDTTKVNATEHGYGLPAVKYILNQLDAEYTFAYKNGWFQFVAEISE